jgi:hypothetical protein
VFDFIGVLYAAKGQVQQFPFTPDPFIDFRCRKFIGHIIAQYMGMQGNTVPEYGGVVTKNFHCDIVYIGFFIPNTACFNDFKLPGFFPGAAYMDKF